MFGHLEAKLIEIDENLCRSELTASQRSSYTKRRKAIWEAMHPAPKMSPAFAAVFGQELAHAAVLCDESGTPIEVGPQGVALLDEGLGGTSDSTQLDSRGQKKSPQQEKSFAAETAATTGMTKQAINRHIARAEALGVIRGLSAVLSVQSKKSCFAFQLMPPKAVASSNHRYARARELFLNLRGSSPMGVCILRRPFEGKPKTRRSRCTQN